MTKSMAAGQRKPKEAGTRKLDYFMKSKELTEGPCTPASSDAASASASSVKVEPLGPKHEPTLQEADIEALEKPGFDCILQDIVGEIMHETDEEKLDGIVQKSLSEDIIKPTEDAAKSDMASGSGGSTTTDDEQQQLGHRAMMLKEANMGFPGCSFH